LGFSRFYSCWSDQLTSIIPDTRITRITGDLDCCNLSVELVSIQDTSVTFIPDFTLVTKKLLKFKRPWIYDCGLRYVERRQLAKMPQLTELKLDDNIIEHLPENVFSDLVNLEVLDVSYNHIKVLPSKLLWNLPKLKQFKANANHIELIARDFFKNNRELEKLYIYSNEIMRIEADFTLLLQSM
jgi:Leucine-rich repeat (LRR) protein